MENIVRATLADGTFVRHKAKGYEGRIEGITAIKACFTREGAVVAPSLVKDVFQYRIVVKGESMRRIAPAEDLEIVEEKIEASPSTTSSQNKKANAETKRKRRTAPDKP